MPESILEELTKRLNAKTIHELRQLGRALGVPHPADGKKDELVGEIIAVASAKKDSEPPSKRGAPPKSQEYDRQLAADLLRCREIFLAKNLPTEQKPSEIFVGSGDSSALDYIGGGILENDGDT
ncbi:MAG: Rho termination factor N-terminal domain-containing protein, partial [Clostridia bacterium]|nr:Rho termination factor N-terminal domain-containing protein [Clostridia bacterium]